MGAETLDLLRSWRGGDPQALEELLRRHLPWIRDYVRKRLGAKLRAREETQDVVQDAVVDVLNYGPRFEIRDDDCFRGLLARIVENNIRDRNKWLHRARRDADRERSRWSDTILALDPPVDSVTNPSDKASAAETEEWIRLALELLDPGDREVIVYREFEELSFREVGEKLGVPENTARMRFQRVLPRLAKKVAELRRGGIKRLLQE